MQEYQNSLSCYLMNFDNMSTAGLAIHEISVAVGGADIVVGLTGDDEYLQSISEGEVFDRFVSGVVTLTGKGFEYGGYVAGSVGVLSGGMARGAARSAARGGAAAGERVVAAGGGSIRQAVTAANQAGLSQTQAVQALTRVIEASGRNVGAVVEVGGARILTDVVPGAGQPIVHISASGTATFGSATVSFGAGLGGSVAATVTNIVLP